jgi:biotin synthase
MIFERSLSQLLSVSQRLRKKFFGNEIELRVAHNYLLPHRCPADCRFCSWSVNTKLDYAEANGLVIAEEDEPGIAPCSHSVEMAMQFGAGLEFVSNVERLQSKKLLRELAKIIRSSSKIVRIGLQPGIIGPADKSFLAELKEAGLSWYCNDLETSPSYFPQVCTTHSMREKVESLRMAKEIGIPVWSGFCMGMGETEQQRVEAIETLGEINVEGVILNFFYDFPGIPLHGKVRLLTPEEILKTIAVVRIMLPEKPIIIGGGRSVNLGDQSPRIYEAGATGIYLGVFLNHLRPSVERDIQVISELGLKVARHS